MPLGDLYGGCGDRLRPQNGFPFCQVMCLYELCERVHSLKHADLICLWKAFLIGDYLHIRRTGTTHTCEM